MGSSQNLGSGINWCGGGGVKKNESGKGEVFCNFYRYDKCTGDGVRENFGGGG